MIATPPTQELLKAAAAAAHATRTLHQAAARLGLPLRATSALIRQAAAEGLLPRREPVAPSRRCPVRLEIKSLTQVLDGAKSIREVADQLGMPYQTAVSNLRRAVKSGLIPAEAVPDGRPRKKTGISIQELIQALDGAISVREVADRLGLPYHNALSDLRQAVKDGLVSAEAVPRGRRGKKPGITIHDLTRALDGARSVREVADHLGLPYERTRTSLRKAVLDGFIPAEAVPDGRPGKKLGIPLHDLTRALDGARSVREVADRLGLSYARTGSKLRRAVRDRLIPADIVPDGRTLRQGLPSAFKESLLVLREQGMTYRDIGDRHGLTRERIRQILKSVGRDGRIPKESRIPDRISAVLDEAHELARSGETLAEIARRLGVNSSSLSSALAERFGFRFRVGSRPKPGRDAEVVKLHAEGLTQAEIGCRLGVSQPIVSRFFKRLGLVSTLNRPRPRPKP